MVKQLIILKDNVNKDYKNAIRIFEYVIKEYAETPNYQISRRLVITCREEIVKNTFPVEDVEIRTLINDYNQLKIGMNSERTRGTLTSIPLMS